MKLYITILLGLFLPTVSTAWEGLTISQLKTLYSDTLLREQEELMAIKELQAIKSYILNGETWRAKYLLTQIKSHSPMSEQVKLRYLATIDFIENRYVDGLKHLDTPNFNSFKQYSELCLLRMIFQLGLGQLEELNKSLSICFPLNEPLLRNEGLWLEMLFKLKKQDPLIVEKKQLSHWFPDIQFISEEVLVLWLKLGIYLNQEKEMRPLLQFLDDHSLSYIEIRELSGFYYYRLGELELAKKLMENIGTPNAENVLGNILVQQKQYELAFRHFQLAIKNKRNSLNAVERGVPLSWILKEWSIGRDWAQRLPDTLQFRKEKWGLLAAYSLQLEDYEKVAHYLDLIHGNFGTILPTDINLLGSYYSLMIMDDVKLRFYSEAACRQFDATACLLLMQSSLWPELAKFVLSEKKEIPPNEFSIEELKKKIELKPLNDIPIIDQKNIEELDVSEYELKYFGKKIK